ncbi:hypothetical protein TanjilG_01196 [Lupinus angustifolius]|uniref:Fe2OG dioxygenase domain-containing protein n=1 Tax=Lupinus angustifolius TaxID=3871 RepID=A0A1J7HH34_LUPAN|nr:hypothetical protein TanjilG_01196 [Lupinus angustifolius]
MEVTPFDQDAEYDRAKEVKEFDETKAGVKGLVDSGIIKLPRFFIHSPETLSFAKTKTPLCFQVPVIDFTGYDERYRREEIICEICEASETLGFFQMVNHGVPVCVMDDMLRVVKEFHEQPKEVKKEWYSRDHGVKVRDAVSKYINHIMKLREILSELLSEALGLKREYLGSIECMKSETMVCHYYPACPEPNLTFGSTKHSDPSSLTILLQDTIGGLQVFHENQWVDVNPVQGALVVNIGDFMQC